MDKGEFLSKLERLYPSRFNVKSDEIRTELINEYADVFNIRHADIDYDLMWKILRDEYDYTTTPPTNFFSKNLHRCVLVKKGIDTSLNDTKTVKVTFPWQNGYEYEFVVQKHQTEKDVLKAYMPKNWRWNYTLNAPEKGAS